MNSEKTDAQGSRPLPKALIEAALFLSSDPVKKSELQDLTGLSEKQLEKTINDLRADLSNSQRGLKLFENNESCRFKVKRELLGMVKHFAPHQDISKGVLRTLSVIAYNSPVLQKEVIEIRGNGAYDHIDKLIERGFVKSEQEGRTKLLSVTQYFLDYFELKNLEELKERKDTSQELSN